MLLHRIEIANFRGIKRLSINMDELSVLIGENAWGKSSLLDALDIMLSPSFDDYQCQHSDFHVDHTLKQPTSDSLHIILVWQEDYDEEHKLKRYRHFIPFWRRSLQHPTQCVLSMSAHRQSSHKIHTEYHFLDQHGEPIPCDNIKSLFRAFRVLHPLVRIRDARRLRNRELEKDTTFFLSSDVDSDIPLNDFNQITSPEQLRLVKRLNNTCRRLLDRPGHVNSGELKSTVNALHSLIEHYFAFTPHNRQHTKRAIFGSEESSPLIWLEKKDLNKQQKLLLISLLNAYIRARGPVNLRRVSRPILILEDPEGRLHPTLLHQAWEFFSLLPIQKIVTTNSAELLASTPLHSIKRLQRLQNKTVVFSMSEFTLSNDQSRRIAFHIRNHRPNALFARVWLLVEGETEVWLFSELSKLLNYHLASEGIQLIDFAQSGLKSLLKTANQFGIEWHLFVDGDPAGRKYAHSAEQYLNDHAYRSRITVLPKRDIEQFLYNEGFAKVFHHLANVNLPSPLTPRRIITKALKHHAKPDVAIAIVKQIEEAGVHTIPLIFRRTLMRVIAMSRGQN